MIAILVLTARAGYAVSGLCVSWTADFVRTMTKQSGSETQRGRIYYLRAQSAIIVVTEPLRQWISVAQETTTVYYPEEKTALRFIGKRGFDLSIMELFMGVANGDFGLASVGFVLEESQLRLDTLVSLWKPSAASGLNGKAKVIAVRDVPVVLELSDSKGRITKRTMCSAFHQEGGIIFPVEVVQVQHFGADSTSERFSYANARFNAAPPESVSAFKLPEGVQIQEIEW